MSYNIPTPIKNFVFDLYASSRKSLRTDEVSQFYEVKFKEITDKYFSQSAWPESEVVATDCMNDEVFLLFYKEMTARHLFTKLKPQISDFIKSWNTYVKLFDFILSSENPEIAMTINWVSDITAEFVYQFQGFCQFRSQLSTRNAEEIRQLEENKNIWILQDVQNILIALEKPVDPKVSIVRSYFSCFAAVELARLECLIGEYENSIKWLSPSNVSTQRIEYIQTILIEYANVYYHSAISYLMLRKYNDAITTLAEISHYLYAVLKPQAGGGGHRHGGSFILKMFDKILSLFMIASILNPGYRIDDQLREYMEIKYSDKYRRLQSADMPTVTDMFENACPKFIYSEIPNYSLKDNFNQQAYSAQVSIFITDASNILSVLKLRSYLRVYTSIEVSKLARITNINEDTLLTQLSTYKEKTANCIMDVTFHLRGPLIFVEEILQTSKNDIDERYFITATRKHNEIIKDIRRTFNRYGL